MEDKQGKMKDEGGAGLLFSFPAFFLLPFAFRLFYGSLKALIKR